ncbi:iron ABC transporter ATP-binding protein [Gelidibacter maritimus]|uniref:ATP-binding cassette domain-containing protein n=1 Tax=Gelidibacter maritimus TaxID=2761487 RepID=A0A7W2M605_9FLAO|nr:ATP-binding cassette domain-containing protein [Gelidibacter maritimus]MBA6153126.1 ATP-binding cassette domain-containing protein [Gelidibacter maritimus]
MIEIKNISKHYGDHVVLNDISLRFPKGKITSLIGSNGTGKSTLLSIMSRLLVQDNGEVFVNEKKNTDYKSAVLSQHLSILKQFNNIELKLTVKELVSFGRFPYSQGRLSEEDHEKIEETLGFLDLIELQDMYLEALSGGQRQRAYLAMVVAQDTEYILLDEPLNNLDMRHSVQIMKILRKLTEVLGKTIIVVLHDINFASHYSDYIAALKNGRVKYFGKANEIINEDILKDLFGISFCISQSNGKKLCNYFNHFN